MAHEFESGFFAKEPAWHNLGVVIPDLVDSKEAIALASLDWEVIQSPVLFKGKDGVIEEIPGHVINVRASDMHPLGVVTNKYRIIQNAEAFEFMDNLVTEGAIKYETAGSLREGRVIWMLARLPEDQKIGDDEHRRYLLLSNSHDGSRALRVYWTSVRVVCMNTLNLSTQGVEVSFNFYHRGDANKKIEKARGILGLAVKSFDQYRELGLRLQGIKFVEEEVNKYLDYLFPKVSKEAVENNFWGTWSTRHKLGERILSGEGIGLNQYHGTAWAALQATVEYNTWEGGNSDENRVRSLWFGSRASLNNRALGYMANFANTYQGPIITVVADLPAPAPVASLPAPPKNAKKGGRGKKTGS